MEYEMKIQNPYLPLDQNQNPVHAHGGHIQFFEGYYYWIGENRTGDNKVSCYKTKDFKDWSFCNHILTIDSKCEKHYIYSDLELKYLDRTPILGKGVNIERPKVIYNKKTKKFVMWMHFELPDDYKEARCAVAVCDTIDGDYTYLGSFNPIGNMSRDCTLFVEDDGTAYFISASRENLDLHIYRLSEDYLCIDKLLRVLWPSHGREAPTMFKKDGLYYLLSSGCTGWASNQSTYSYADKIDGDYKPLRNFGNENTFVSQPTCVLKLTKDNVERYYYIGDRWGDGITKGFDYFKSKTVILPIQFKDDHEIEIAWSEEVTLEL